MAEASAGRNMKQHDESRQAIRHPATPPARTARTANPARHWLRAMGLALAVVLAGCAGLPIGQVPAPDAEEPRHGRGPEAPISELPGDPQAPPEEFPELPGGAGPDVELEPDYHPAGQALIDEARRERVLGRDAAAGATLERALRIDSQNPWIWIELGKLRLAAGELAATRSMAQKALTLADRDPAARAEAGYLLRQADGGS